VIDIAYSQPGLDLGTHDTQTFRAKNILSIQLGELVYEPELGIDLKFFLSEEFRFENASFKSYLIQVLAARSINVASIDNSAFNLFEKYTFNLTPAENQSALVAR
jgi:hypothetical protein